jgi:hypothetical protein
VRATDRIVTLERGRVTRRFDITWFLGAIRTSTLSMTTWKNSGETRANSCRKMFRRRLDEKFQRGAENQAYLLSPLLRYRQETLRER